MSGDPTVWGVPWHAWSHQSPVCGGFIPQPFVFTPTAAPQLSDVDVERIARRMVELLREDGVK